MSSDARREQHRRRLSYMPWLYLAQRERPHLSWLSEWQQEVQRELTELETISFGQDCFVAPEAALFAEPHRAIQVGDRCTIAASVFIHGPVSLGDDVSLNIGVCMDGGAKGIVVGSGTRLAAHVKLYAFDHGFAPDRRVSEQAVRSRGIRVGRDVWIAAGASITDGVTIGDGAIVAMGAVVTRDVDAFAVVGGVPARVLGDRREWPPQPSPWTPR